jgi:hypothetical protein
MSRVVFVVVLAVVAPAIVWNFAPYIIGSYRPQSVKSPSARTARAESNQPTSRVSKPVFRQKPAETSPDIPVVAPAPKTAEASPVAAAPKPAKAVFRVVTEIATLYSTNTASGEVVGQLYRGDVVEPQFTLNNAGQEWTFVSLADQGVSGFLRSANLGRKQAEQTSR